MMGAGGAAFFLKSTTTVFRALSSRLLQMHQLCSHSITLLYADSSPLEMSPTRLVLSTSFRSLTDGCREMQLLVHRENRVGDRMQPREEPVLVDLEGCEE